MQIFNQEIKDGLEDSLKKCTASIDCLLSKSESPSQNTLKSIAALGEGKNFDLYYLQSILASAGPNKNDDVFLPEEIWAARHTPVHKQLNYMHNEKDIIGVITDSIVLDSTGAVINDESQIVNIKDIATQAVIWTKWDDKEVELKINKIIASIEENKLFVSMEALFKKFDYMLIENGTTKIVPRTEQTSFLTKYLRSFGGDGFFEGARIYRVLRDFTFSGKGIVSEPANPRSIISESIFIDVSKYSDDFKSEDKNLNHLVSTKAEYIMEDELKKEIAELKTALAKANETIESVKAAETKKVTAEVEDLKSQVEALKTLAAETKAKMDEMEKDCAEKMDKMKKESEDKVADAETKLAEATAKLAEMESAKITAERVSKLTSLNVPADKAQEVVKTFASLSDELFEQIVPLYETKVDTSKAKAESEDVDDAISKSKASEKVDAKIDGVDSKGSDIEELSKSIATKLNFKKSK